MSSQSQLNEIAQLWQLLQRTFSPATERRGESTSAGGRISWKGGCTHCHTRSLWFYFSGHRKSVTPDLAGRFRDGVDWRTVIPMVVFSLWNSAPKAKNMTGQRITKQQKQVEISWNFIKYLTIPFILLPPLLFYCHFKVVHTYQEANKLLFFMK
jgi:hypothetical protein